MAKLPVLRLDVNLVSTRIPSNDNAGVLWSVQTSLGRQEEVAYLCQSQCSPITQLRIRASTCEVTEPNQHWQVGPTFTIYNGRL